ncbi:Proteophosphoglycan ppg4 [Rhodotorula toruloides ATCC 204091]|uniref:BY PROTMAP: gi/342319463/gb/EGU11411.1/ Proteophosphoglycan ppg4 [Rhodotorula glutinis ATCC 204091] n=1 Tax=Rhodotorula toruloides TaxID=5286 RepID=A0A0K3CNV8_RHOTO|nr:Proteophosphoglycan ppg4 [Rhodotorula toruloides ATCC 204091]
MVEFEDEADLVEARTGGRNGFEWLIGLEEPSRLSAMSFFSRLSSKSKDRRSSSETGSSAAAPKEDLLPLQLPSSSLLTDASLANPLLLSTPTRNRYGEDNDLRSLRSAETSPWVDVGETPRTFRTLDVKGKRVKVPELFDPVREKKEKVRLEKARLGVAEMTLLMDECGSVLKQRGLTTLGLFRPFRAAESLSAQRKLCLLFLDYMAELDAAPSSSDSIRGSEASKAVLLHAFKEELRYANVHDAAAVLRWVRKRSFFMVRKPLIIPFLQGLRHFSSTPSFSGSPTPSIDWYTSFLRRSSSFAPSHPPHSFSAFLLPSLPPASQALLLSTLTLLQAVSANAQHNAMTARRLCRSLGIYLFGMSPSSGSSSFDDLYNAWREAGDALEGCLKAFLREQTDLPPRLQELVDDYPAWVAAKMNGSSENGRKVRVVKVEVESKGEWRQVGEAEVNDQETGFVARGRGAEGPTDKPARRRPVEILLAAVEADPLAGDVETDEAATAWSRIVERAKKGGEDSGATVVLEDEVLRVLELLALDQPTTVDDSDPFAGDGSPRPRVRSLISDRRSSSFGTFSNYSTGNLLTPSPSQRTITPTWNDFKQTGFAPTELDAANEFGLYNPEIDGRFTKPARLPRKVVEPEHRIVGVSVCEVDEEFPDVWIDTLGESTSTFAPVAGWPSLVVAPLQPSVVSHEDGAKRTIHHLVIYEKLLPPAHKPAPFAPRPSLPSTASQPGVHRAFSTASILGRRGRKSDIFPAPTSAADGESTLSPGRKWRRRASAIFAPGSSETDKPKREWSSESSTNLNLPSSLSTLLPSGRRNRKSFVAADLPPPVPAISTAVPLSEPSEKSPTSPTSPSSMVRSFSRNLVKKRSRSSLYSLSRQRSPISEEGEPVPVPPLPAQFAEEANETAESGDAVEPETEGYTVEPAPTSPVAHDGEKLPEATVPAPSIELAQPVVDKPEQTAPVAETAAPTEEKEVREDAHDGTISGLPVLGAPVTTSDSAAEALPRDERNQAGPVGSPVVEPLTLVDEEPSGPVEVPAAHTDDYASPSSAEELSAAPVDTGDSTPAGDQPVPVAEQPPVLASTEAASHQYDAEPALEQPAADAEQQDEPATPASPLVTLSPPPEDAVQSTETILPVGANDGAAPLGLGLVNAPIQAVEPEPKRSVDASLATPSKSSNAQLASHPTTSNSALSPASPSLTNSPTPSTSSTASRKFLSNNPTPVSNVKARVKEIEEEQAAVSGAASTTPTTPTRDRTFSGIARPLSMVSPRSASEALPNARAAASPSPASPTPASPAQASASPTAPGSVPAQLFASSGPSSPSTATVEQTSQLAKEASEVSGAISAPDDVFAAPSPPVVEHDAPSTLEAQLLDGEGAHPPPAIQVDAAPEEPAISPSTANGNVSGALAAASHEPVEAHTLVFDRDTPVAAPQQETQHLNVKVPSSFAELPSPMPSPTPFSEIDGDQHPLAEDLTEKIPELHPPVFEPIPPAPESHTLPTVPQPVEPTHLDSSHESAAPEPAVGDIDARPHDETAADEDPRNFVTSSGVEHDVRSATPVEHHARAETIASPAQDPSATPTKPSTSLIPPQVVHNSPSQQSLATTTSFETANSAAPSTTRASLDEASLCFSAQPSLCCVATPPLFAKAFCSLSTAAGRARSLSYVPFLLHLRAKLTFSPSAALACDSLHASFPHVPFLLATSSFDMQTRRKAARTSPSQSPEKPSAAVAGSPSPEGAYDSGFWDEEKQVGQKRTRGGGHFARKTANRGAVTDEVTGEAEEEPAGRVTRARRRIQDVEAAAGVSPSPSPELPRSPDKVVAVNETPARQEPSKPRTFKPSPQWMFNFNPGYAISNTEAEGTKLANQRKTSPLVSPEKPQGLGRESSVLLRHKHKPIAVSKSPSSNTLSQQRPKNATFFEVLVKEDAFAIVAATCDLPARKGHGLILPAQPLNPLRVLRSTDASPFTLYRFPLPALTTDATLSSVKVACCGQVFAGLTGSAKVDALSKGQGDSEGKRNEHYEGRAVHWLLEVSKDRANAIAFETMSDNAASPRTSPEPAVKESASMRLPDETWVSIFRLLTYKTLLHVRGVCKRFKGLLENSTFDDVFFRQAPPKRPETKQKYKVHPMLNDVDCARVTPTTAEIMHYGQGSGDETFNGYDYPAAKEFATAPACMSIDIELNESKVGKVSNKRGVTVSQVLVACGKFWEKPVPDSVASRVGSSRRDWERERFASLRVGSARSSQEPNLQHTRLSSVFATPHFLASQSCDRLSTPATALEAMSLEATEAREVPHTAVTSPAALRLSDELWVRIFSQLGYTTLLHARGICRRLKALLERPTFDAAFFRQPPPDPPQRRQRYFVHPMLEAVDCGRVTQEMAKITHWSKQISDFDWVEFNGFDYATVEEFATTPACVSIEIELADARVGRVYDEQGVTVKQVLHACADFWAKPVHPWTAKKVREEYKWLKDKKPITALGMLSDRFFEGWEEPKNVGNGRVHLISRGFGS